MQRCTTLLEILSWINSTCNQGLQVGLVFIYNINNVLSCTSGWLLLRRGREAMQESRKRRRRRKEDSELSGKVVQRSLPVSVCLPEQHSPTAQQRKGTRGWKKEMERKWKHWDTKEENPPQNHRENSRKGEKQDHRRSNQSFEPNVEIFVKKKKKRWVHSKYFIVEKIENTVVYLSRGKKSAEWKHPQPQTHI